MFINYLALAVVMYIAVRLFRIMLWRKEHKYTRIAAGVFLTVTMVMMWNIIAESRFNLESWVDFEPTMKPAIVEELGLDKTEGEIIYK